MRYLKQVIWAAALTLLSSGILADTTPGNDRQARALWHEAILNGYQTLEARAGQFSAAARDYCSAPSGASRDRVEQAWLDAFLAWQKIRFVDFGPIETDNRAWQFQFWPDPKNLIARKARYLLTSEVAPTAEQVEQSGVAVQGFPMAEYLLYDEQLNGAPEALPAANACSLLRAIAQHIEANAERLVSDWQLLREHYLTTEQYRDATIKAGMAGLEILEERRLAQPMGLKGTGKRSAYVADAWRSGTSLMAMEASVNGLKTYFLPGLSLLLAHSSQPELAGRIETQFDEVLENFPELRVPMAPLLAGEGYSRLQGFYVDVSQLAILVNDQAAVELGVVRGFNSSDGD